MSLGIKIIFLLIGGALAIGLIVVFVVPRKSATLPPIIDNGNESPNGQDKKVEEVVVKDEQSLDGVKPPLGVEEKEREIIRQRAIAFAERFGSFSEQSHFENITDLYPLMTSHFKSVQESMVEKARTQITTPSALLRVSTRSISVNISKISADTLNAIVVVNTQRQETKEGKQRVYYQPLRLTFQKENNLWQVDEAAWK